MNLWFFPELDATAWDGLLGAGVVEEAVALSRGTGGLEEEVVPSSWASGDKRPSTSVGDPRYVGAS